MKPRRFTVQWFVQQVVAWLIPLFIVCVLLMPEALIGPVS
jgi:hypothetical protein